MTKQNDSGKLVKFQIEDLYKKIDSNHIENVERFDSVVTMVVALSKESKEDKHDIFCEFKTILEEIKGIRTDLNGIGQKVSIVEVKHDEHVRSHKFWLTTMLGSTGVTVITGIILWIRKHI